MGDLSPDEAVLFTKEICWAIEVTENVEPRRGDSKLGLCVSRSIPQHEMDEVPTGKDALRKQPCSVSYIRSIKRKITVGISAIISSHGLRKQNQISGL